MSDKRRGLGRGLGALIPSTAPPTRPAGERPVDVFFPGRPNPDAPGGDVATADGTQEAVLTGTAPRARSDAPARALPTQSPEQGTERPQDSPQADRAGGDRAGADRSQRTDPSIERDPSGRSNGTDGDGAPVPGDVTPAPAPQDAGESESAEGRTGDGDTSRSAPDGSETARRVAAAANATPVDASPAQDGLVPVPGAHFAEIPLDAIRPNPRQPRVVFDEEALAELVHSIREIGVLQPVVVRPIEDEDGERRYELIMGERRWRATREAGLEVIPAIVRETSDDDLLRDALLENLHRSDLNALEEAAAYQQLLDDFGCTHEELATRIGRSRPQISNTLRLLKLPPLVQRRVAAGVLSAGHARALLGLEDSGSMERLAQRIVSEGLSVRAVEEIVSLGDGPVPKQAKRRPRAGANTGELDDLASRLGDRLDTRVTVALGRSRGRLSIDFASVEDLNRIIGLLAPDVRKAFTED